ncbi:AI-2E family transporter [uncultured Desulfovibrio sp.]|nr:AI-2E family transporter [uncultured Desulfovibrio sp.]
MISLRKRHSRAMTTSVHFPRVLYLLALLAAYLLLRPNPVTIFMAGSFACLSLPLYRRLVRRACRLRRRFLRHPAGLTRRLLLKMARQMPLFGYTGFLLLVILIPVATLVLLVSPQVAGGLARLRELQEHNFQLPPEWVKHFQSLEEKLSHYPGLESAYNEFFQNIDSTLSDGMGILLNRSFDVLGGTMNALWSLVLFVILTVIFVTYARRIAQVASRLTQIPPAMLRRFVGAIRRALRGIMLGILLVAVAQGVLCGIGFSVAGINQPAFWGLLATVVAPIPFVGTALVWVPLCLSLWFSGNPMAAAGLALWGSLAVAGVDNVLRPLFLRQGINAPFFVLIIAILCGLTSFGAVGLIVGPILLAFALQALEEARMLYEKQA